MCVRKAPRRRKTKQYEGMMTKDYREFVSDLFVSRRDGEEGFLHAAVGLAGESAEILDHMKKHWVYGREMIARRSSRRWATRSTTS
jgi:hypothetical protein